MDSQRRPEGAPPGQGRVLIPALVVWGLASLLIQSAGVAPWVFLSVIVLGGCFIIARVSARNARVPRLLWQLLAITCAFSALIAARVWVMEETRADASLAEAAAKGRSVSLDVTLNGYPKPLDAQASQQRFWVRATHDGLNGPVPLLLWLNEAPLHPAAPGASLRVAGKPQVLAPSDLAAYSLRVSQIDASASEVPLPSLGVVATQLRENLRQLASSVPGAELVPGFAVGDTSLIPDALAEQMLASSLTHLTAVSGANCAMVIGSVTWLLAWGRVGRRVRVLAGGAALIGFLIVVGPDPSVQRAALMAGVVLISSFGGKRSRALPALGLAVLVLLVIDPWQALQAGFALSVAATGGIVLLAALLAKTLALRMRLPQPLAVAVSLALAAQLACGPILILLQPGVPVVGVLANVLAAPAAPAGTGLGLLALLASGCGPFGAVLAQGLVWLASLPARWVSATATVCAEIPFGRWEWPTGIFGAVLLLAVELSLWYAWAFMRGHVGVSARVRVLSRMPWGVQPESSRVVRLVPILLVVSATASIVAASIATPLAERLGVPQNWVVVACDVGQGDALLLRDPAQPDRVMLVDTGNEPERLSTCLRKFGVTRVSLLVLTHDDLDHVGAMEVVLPVSEQAIIAPSISGEAEEQRAVVRLLRRAEVPYEIGVRGLAGGWSDASLNWEVLAPEGFRVPRSTNAASVVMAVRATGINVLLLGDTGADEQHLLLNLGDRIEAEVLKVAHHGSRDQDGTLPARVAATWALLSVGAENRYGHPVTATLDAIEASGARVLRTDQMGSVALVQDTDGSLRAWVERAG